MSNKISELLGRMYLRSDILHRKTVMLTNTSPHVLGIRIDIPRGLVAKVTGLQVGIDLMTVWWDFGQEVRIKIDRYKETAARRKRECSVEKCKDEDIHIRGGGDGGGGWFFSPYFLSVLVTV